MPTTKRRCRKQRQHLSVAQHEDLMFGYRMFSREDAPGFASEADERRAWEANRQELMAAAGPGRRPWAYFHFELGETKLPLWWWQQITVLEHHGLIDKAEEIQVEHHSPLLAAKQDATYSEPISLRDYSVETLRHTRDEWRVASAWHAKRNRPELADMYQQRAACLDAWIREKTLDATKVSGL